VLVFDFVCYFGGYRGLAFNFVCYYGGLMLIGVWYLNLVSGLVHGGRFNYNTITTNVLTPRLFVWWCCSYSANCVIMFSYILVICITARKSKTSKRCLNSSVQSDPDYLVVHQEQWKKLWRVALWSRCHSFRMRADGSKFILAKLIILSHPCQHLKLRYKTVVYYFVMVWVLIFDDLFDELRLVHLH